MADIANKKFSWDIRELVRQPIIIITFTLISAAVSMLTTEISDLRTEIGILQIQIASSNVQMKDIVDEIHWMRQRWNS